MSFILNFEHNTHLFLVIFSKQTFPGLKAHHYLLKGSNEDREIKSLDILSFSIVLPANIYLLKVNNRSTRRRYEACSQLTIKNNRTTSMTSFWCFILLTLNTLHTFSSVSIVDSEQVNVSWIDVNFEEIFQKFTNNKNFHRDNKK